MISGFHLEVAKNCDLLGYYAASSGKYHYLLHNNPEECSSHIKIKINQIASVITSILNNVMTRTGNLLMYISYKIQKIILPEKKTHASEDILSMHV
jgi:hypothetical protein